MTRGVRGECPDWIKLTRRLRKLLFTHSPPGTQSWGYQDPKAPPAKEHFRQGRGKRKKKKPHTLIKRALQVAIQTGPLSSQRKDMEKILRYQPVRTKQQVEQDCRWRFLLQNLEESYPSLTSRCISDPTIPSEKNWFIPRLKHLGASLAISCMLCNAVTNT